MERDQLLALMVATLIAQAGDRVSVSRDMVEYALKNAETILEVIKTRNQ